MWQSSTDSAVMLKSTERLTKALFIFSGFLLNLFTITKHRMSLLLTFNGNLTQLKSVLAYLFTHCNVFTIYLQYYDDTYPTVKEQKAFEKNIFNKTHRTDSKR